MRARITNDNQQATMAESMAELEIVPRPEVTAAISDDPNDLSDVSSEDEEEEEEFTAIELVRAVPVPDLVPVPAVQVPVFRLPVYWYSSATSVEFDLVLIYRYSSAAKAQTGTTSATGT